MKLSGRVLTGGNLYFGQGRKFLFKAPTGGKKTMRPQEVYKEEWIIFPQSEEWTDRKRLERDWEHFMKEKQ